VLVVELNINRDENFSAIQSKQTSFIQAISVHYLNALVDNLCSIGYHHLSLPITSLLRCLAKHVIENEVLLKLIHWRLVEMMYSLVYETIIMHRVNI
jgi:hypothetical protein